LRHDERRERRDAGADGLAGKIRRGRVGRQDRAIHQYAALAVEDSEGGECHGVGDRRQVEADGDWRRLLGRRRYFIRGQSRPQRIPGRQSAGRRGIDRDLRGRAGRRDAGKGHADRPQLHRHVRAGGRHS
jgi:hypothetical protein